MQAEYSCSVCIRAVGKDHASHNYDMAFYPENTLKNLERGSRFAACSRLRTRRLLQLFVPISSQETQLHATSKDAETGVRTLTVPRSRVFKSPSTITRCIASALPRGVSWT